MKKALLTVGSGVGVVAGALVIWNVVIPVISSIFSMFGTVANSASSTLAAMITSLF